MPHGVTPRPRAEARVPVDPGTARGVPVEVERVGEGETHAVPQRGRTEASVLPVDDAGDPTTRPQEVAAPEVAVGDVTRVEVTHPRPGAPAHLRRRHPDLVRPAALERSGAVGLRLRRDREAVQPGEPPGCRVEVGPHVTATTRVVPAVVVDRERPTRRDRRDEERARRGLVQGEQAGDRPADETGVELPQLLECGGLGTDRPGGPTGQGHLDREDRRRRTGGRRHDDRLGMVVPRHGHDREPDRPVAQVPPQDVLDGPEVGERRLPRRRRHGRWTMTMRPATSGPTQRTRWRFRPRHVVAVMSRDPRDLPGGTVAKAFQNHVRLSTESSTTKAAVLRPGSTTSSRSTTRPASRARRVRRLALSRRPSRRTSRFADDTPAIAAAEPRREPRTSTTGVPPGTSRASAASMALTRPSPTRAPAPAAAGGPRGRRCRPPAGSRPGCSRRSGCRAGPWPAPPRPRPVSDG